MSIFKACNQEYNESLNLKKAQELAEKEATEAKKRLITEKFAPSLEAIVAFLSEEKTGIEQEGFHAYIETIEDDDRFTLARLYFDLGVEGKLKRKFRFMASVNSDFTANAHGWINTVGANFDTIFERGITPFGEAGFRKSLEESFREFVKIAFQKCDVD